MRRVAGDLALGAAALAYGTTFLVVKDAVEVASPSAFLALRFLIAATVLAPFALRRPATAGLVRDGVAAGGLYAAGFVLQTVGLQYTSASVSAFLTYLLVLFVPLMSAALLRRRPAAGSLAGVAIAMPGLMLLTGATGGAGVGRGEILTAWCAVAFAGHLIVVSRVAARHDVLRFAAVQLATVGLVTLVPAVGSTGGLDAGVMVAATYTAVVASVVALSLQVWGQRRVPPTRAALVLLLEPVAAAALGAATGDQLGLGGAVGATLILGAIAVSELWTPGPERRIDRPVAVGEP